MLKKVSLLIVTIIIFFTPTIVFGVNKVTVNYDLQGGTASKTSDSVIVNSTYGDLPVPTRSDYTFGGWYTGKSGSGTRVLSATLVTNTSDHTLYAKWISNTSSSNNTGVCGNAIQVTFNAMGGYMDGVATACANYNFKYGSMFRGGLPTPSRKGYDFLGWYTDRFSGTLVTDETLVTNRSDHILYAHWAPLYGGKKSTLSMEEGDYSLECSYSNGIKVTISYGKLFVEINSNEINAANKYMFLVPNIYNNVTDTQGVITDYKYDEWFDDTTCPNLIRMTGKVTTYEDKDAEEPVEIGSFEYDLFSLKPKAYKNGATCTTVAEINRSFRSAFRKNALSSDNASISIMRKDNFDCIRDETYWIDSWLLDYSAIQEEYKPIHEEYILTTDKITPILDYETVTTESYSSKESISIYLYNGLTLLERNGIVSRLDNVDAIVKDDERSIYVNNLSPKFIANTTTVVYNSDSYYIAGKSNAKLCRDKNNGEECTLFSFVGVRNESSEETDTRVCDILGTKTVIIIQNIIRILQIGVPALVIVLIGIDITKMVLSGNLDEELPKKKKSIIIRLVIMVAFFFTPLFAKLIIQLLNASGVNIGDIECIIKSL